jgi:hypothetical protein
MMNKFDVFLSHASKDNETVKRVLQELRQRIPDLTFWIDFEQLQPGMDWANEILEASTASSLMLLFGTENAFASDWVQREIGIGLQRHLFDKVPFILLAFEPRAIPKDLARYQYLDFSSLDEGIAKLARFLRDEFRAKLQPKLAMDSVRILYRSIGAPPRPPCPDILRSLDRSELRSRITKALSRDQVSVLWYDVLGDRMDDEVPGQAKANCVIELLLRTAGIDGKEMLFGSICREYPQVAAT